MNFKLLSLAALTLAAGAWAGCFGCESADPASSAVANATCVIVSAAPTVNTPEPASAPTEYAAGTFVPAETYSPAETLAPIETAAPSLPEFTEEDKKLLVLVNFNHPIYKEPSVVFIRDYLTATNVTCDPRRHADERAVKALDEMLLAAQSEGEYHFVIASAFRTINEQQILWNGRANQDPAYGSDPYNYPVSVMPKNCSEHTTGLAFDILCDNCPHSDPSFIYTAEGRWLAENAWKYGFVLRYPENKSHLTGVRYEPWHFRYVGRTAAAFMHENDLCLEELAEMIGSR